MGPEEQRPGEVARRRREKLQMLREKRYQGEARVEGEEDQDRRGRKLLGALFQRRLQGELREQEKNSPLGREKPLRALEESGAIGEFPRLKALLEQRREGKSFPDVDASSSSKEMTESLHRLKNRASRLADALKNTLAEMDRIKKLLAEGHGHNVAENPADVGQADHPPVEAGTRAEK